MAALTLRSVKGSELTAAEIDANFTNLNTDKLSSTAAGYPAIRTSLNLDFANSQSVDPRITFTRASTATRVRQDGLIEVVASGSPRIDFDPVTQVCKGLLIEEQRTNLITYSENVDKAGWGRQGSIVTATNILAPDGTYTAEYIDNNAGTTSLVYEVVAVTASSTNDYYASIFVKRGTNNTFTMNCYYDGNTEDNVSFNFDNLGAAGAPYVGEYIFQSFGNGWYRCGYRVTRDSTGSKTGLNFRLWQSGRGVATGGLNIWGAQLEVGAFPTSYIPSSDTFTSRASTATYVGSNGLIQSALTNVARYNYNPVNLSLAPKLLLESASTNLLTYSEDFDNASWLKIRSSVTSNTTTAPDGTLTADKLTEDTSVTNSHYIYQPVSVTNALVYTKSIYVKAKERSYCAIQFYATNSAFADGSVSFNLITGTVTSTSGAITNSSIIYIGNGWYRISASSTATATAGGNISVNIGGSTPTTFTYTGDGISGMYIWGAQLEASSFPTSYIPTVASQVTRAADISSSAQTTRVADSAVMTGTNFSSWYSQTEGTVLVGYDMETSTDFYPSAWYMDDGTSLNRFGHSVTAGLKNCNYDSITNNVVQSYLSLGAMPTTVLSAYAYKQNDFVGCAQGGTVITDTSGIQPIVNKLQIGGRRYNAYLNGHISKLSYYPKRLTNSELQALTTG